MKSDKLYIFCIEQEKLLKKFSIFMYIFIFLYFIYCNIKKSYKFNKFEISAPTWNEEFELPDWSYSVSDIQIHFEYILKKQAEKKTDNPLIWI